MTRLSHTLLSAAYLMFVIVRYAVWMPNWWARQAMLALFLVGGIGGIFAADYPIPQPRPTAPVPEVKPDLAAAWNELAAAEARLARKLLEAKRAGDDRQ